MIVRHRYPTPTVDRSFDRVFEQLTNSFFDTRHQAGPTVAGTWNDDAYVLTIDLPGVPADAVSVEVTGTTLLLGAATDTMQWQRSLELGGRLDPDKVTASHVDGRLTVRIGSFDEPEPRRVQIETSPPQAAIETTSEDTSLDESTT
jgi:HSP20 family molecular chaperone IbpA